MKKIHKFGIWAFALVALAGMFPQTVAASGSIRSITAYDPETGHREYGPTDMIRVGESLAFKVRLLNYNTNCTSQGGLNNQWSFRLRTGVDPVFASANLPKMGLWISGHKRLATLKSISLADSYYTDIVFEYKVQSGDFALPVKFCNTSGTDELANSADQLYLLENVGPTSYWELKDEATGHTCEFAFGAQNLVPSSTDNYEYPPAGWTSAYEVRDYDLSQADIYVQTVDFDGDSDPWRTVYENKTTTVEGALPTLTIPGGAGEDSTVYLWTESTNVAYLASGGERIYHSLDHERQPKDYLVYAANIVHATNFTFKVRGAQGAAGQTTTIYLSSTPTNIYNRSGTLITNFVSRTIAVTNQANPQILFELTPDSIVCDVAYGTSKALLKVTVDAFTNAIDVALNPTLGVAGPALPAGMIGLSTSADGALTFLDTLHFPARSSLDDAPITYNYYVFGLGFVTNDTYKTTSQTVVFSPTVSGDGGKYDPIDPVSLTVNEQSAVLSGEPTSISATANAPYDLSLTIADSYANLRDTRGYEVYWSNVTPGELPATASWRRLGSANVLPTRQDDGTYTLDLKLPYPSSGEYDTYIYVKGPDGLTSSRTDLFFTATVASAKRALLLTDHDTAPEGAEWGDRQYYEDEAANQVNVKIVLQSWRNETGGYLYAFLVPQENTAQYVSGAKFLTTTPNARSNIRIANNATNSIASVANSTFYVLDGDKDAGDLNFWVVLATESNWSAVTNGYDDIDEAISLANPKIVFIDTDNDPVEALNREPKFETVFMSGGTVLSAGDGTETQTTARNLLKIFTWSVEDVSADLASFKTRWTVTLPSGAYDPAANKVVIEGNPATTNFQYKFIQTGIYTMKAEIQDKDMLGWIPFTFKVNVGSAPQAKFRFIDDANPSFNEDATRQRQTMGYFEVGLDPVADAPLVIELTRAPILSSGDRGIFEFVGAEADGVKYVTIPAGTEFVRVNLRELDGTKYSSGDYEGGFRLTATVTNTTTNAEGVPYNEVYGVGTVDVSVENVAPTWITADMNDYPYDPGTNDYVDATISANERVRISWEVSDVTADMANNMMLVWGGLKTENNLTYTAGSETSPTGTAEFSFSESGKHSVSLFIRDKDGKASETRRWMFRINPSKDVELIPLRPYRGTGQSTKSSDYLSAPGIGEGRVYSDEGGLTDIRAFRQYWSYGIKTATAPLLAWGYRVGDVDDGNLDPKYDKPITPDGELASTSPYYAYTKQLDSFFYAWIFNAADESKAMVGTAYLAPQVGKEAYAYKNFTLPTETLENDNGEVLGGLDVEDLSFPKSVVEAVFSREWRPADNVGDINQDGVPDVYSVRRWSLGRLYELVGEGGGGEADEAGGIGADVDDIADTDGYNGDEDYLPAPSAGDVGILIPNVVANWATAGESFKAYYEMRGFGDGLNYREDSQAGTKNYNVSGKWISEPDFTPAETNAYLRYCVTKLGTSDPAVVALAATACTDAGGDPTDPDQLQPYLAAALEEYAKSDAFKAAVFQADYLAQVEWSPENRTDPTKDDTDEDGLPDGYEYYFWYQALVGDAKGVQMVGSRFNPDNIAQGIVITPEQIATNFNPTVKATGNVLQRDTDADGLTDLEELAMGTNPVQWDTDGDGMSDLYEVMWGLSPLKTIVEEPSQNNPDGDFMARWESAETWAIVTVPDVGIYAVDESVAVLDGFVPGAKANEGTLDVTVQSSIEGIPVFWYGADNSIAVPKIRRAKADKTLLTSTESVDVSGVTEPITVVRARPIRLIHDQVYTQFGFDPRTGWGRVQNACVATRWDSVNNLVTAEENFNAGDAGLATNTVAFTSLDEYLLCKYAKETGATIGAYEINRFESWVAQHENARRDVVVLLWSWCTCPNKPFADVQYGDGTMTFGSEIYGADTDGDCVPDGWELYVNIPDAEVSYSPLYPETGLLEDKDALCYADEYAGTDSCNIYSNTPSIYANHPGNNIGWYNKFFPTDPHNVDTDGDGVSDSDEGRTWPGTFFAGRKGGETESVETEFTFIYGPNKGRPEGDDGSRCIRGGGLNPCSVDTDGDLLPDGWERQFAGIVFGTDGRPSGTSLSDDVIRQFRVSDGLESPLGTTLATPVGFYITGGQDGTYGPSADFGKKQPGDASTFKGSSAIEGNVDPRTGTVRNCDWDHDGLQNFQEYLVQTLRHLRYDDCETPLMGSQLFGGSLRFVKCLPFQAFDGTAFYDMCRKAGFLATSAWKYRELGYFARPPHEWDPLALNTSGYDPLTDEGNCTNYKDYEGPGYRILLPPQGLAYGASVGSEFRAKAAGYVSTDPRRWDSDDDGLDDFWELFHGLNPLLGKAELIQNGAMNIANDVIAAQYGGVPNSWINGWTGWPMFPSQPKFDAIKYPWMIGTSECDADGDGIRNAEEGLFVSITTPSPMHTDPTPLWMTDSTSPNNASYTVQYYRADPYADPDNMGLADIFNYPAWAWGFTDASGAGEGQAINWMFAFEENEGYDTDGDRRTDSSELVTTVENASDPLKFSDPDRRQALYLPGWQTGLGIGSALVSRGGADTLQKPISSSFDMLRQFTVETWFKPERLDAEQVILERVANYGPSTLSNNTPVIRANFRLGLTADNRIYAECQGNTADSATARLVGPEVTTQEWTHVAFTYDGSTFCLYVNDADVPAASAENNAIIPANGITLIKQEVGQIGTSAITIGNSNYSTVPCAFILGARAVAAEALTLTDQTTWDAFGDYFTGWIDEVRVWDGARTGLEIAADCNRRYTFDEVKDMRQAVYRSWVDGATRNDTFGKMLPVELLQHYNFCTLPGAVDAADVAIEPTDFKKKVLDNVRIDGGTEDVLGVGGLNCGWWYALPVHSDVYYDYHTVPWVQNTCAHLPFMDGSVADSVYWSEGFGGILPASTDDLTSYSFPNTAHPYPFYNFQGERAIHGAQLDAFGESFASYANLYRFQLRANFVGTSDLVPLGGAFAKRAETLWDGKTADAWEQTGVDADANGLPDWWVENVLKAGGVGNVEYTDIPADDRLYTSEGWSAMVTRKRNGLKMKMTLAEAYRRDLADGLVWVDDGTGTYTYIATNISTYVAKTDVNANGILDWWEKLYDIYGESIVGDHDNDQLSNYAEYLIGECFTRVNGTNRVDGYDADNVFKALSPMAMRTYHDYGQIVPDYFLSVGSLYLGEMFTDHDFMEDWWERYIGNVAYASRFSFDPLKDYDSDGWSNYAECRHSLWKSLVTSDVNDRWLDNNLAHVVCRPEPAIGMRVSYYGNQDIDDVPLVVRVSTGNAKIRDALFTVHSSSIRSQTDESYIGPYRKNAVIHGHLNPGNLGPGAGQFYRVPLASDKKYKWSYWYYIDTFGSSTLSYGGADPGYGIGTFEEYLSESAKYPFIELEDVSLEWKQFASTSPIDTDGIYGKITYSASARTNGVATVVSGEIGTINYRTGEYELDMAKLAAAEGTTAELEASVFKVTYNYRLGVEWPQTVYLSKPDIGSQRKPYSQAPATPNSYGTQYNSGYVHEGANVVSAFFDLNGDGSWSAGEPYGACRVDVGWWKSSTAIELTDTHPSMARFDLSAALGSSSSGGSGSQSTAKITDRTANGSLYPDTIPTNGTLNVLPLTDLRLRVVRTAVNGQRVPGAPAFGEVVLDRTFNASLKPLLTEADLMTEGQFDLDWGGVWPVWRDVIGGGDAAFAAIESATYRVVIGNGTTSSVDENNVIPVEFTNAFEPLDDQTRTTPLTPYGTIDSARPTFTWRHDNTIGKSYPAFQLRVWKADGTTLVYDSGIRKAPPRNSQGVYSWTAPLYADMVTGEREKFATTNNYKWAVSMLDAKFTAFRPGETKQEFRLECSGVIGSISDYGTIALKVKYFGPGTVSDAVPALTNLIRVQAFDTPDFTGDPVGETYAKTNHLSSTTILTNNASIIGLAPGTYYVRAFIDTNGDGVHQDWESWGYANYIGTSESAVYNPKGLKIAGDSMNVPEAVIYIEDADTDDDGFPDIFEWNRKGNLTTIGLDRGKTFFTQVNPDLKTNLTAYAGLNLDTGKAMAVASAPVFRMMRAASSPEELNALNALMSSAPEVEVESGIAVTIESFSLEDGVSVKVETAAAVDEQGLMALRTEPISFSLELRHKVSLAESGWETVASVPFAVGANETVTLSADDLAVLREKIAEIQTTGQAGFFKVVLTR